MQICILGLSIRSPLSVCASLPQRAPPAVEHTGLFEWWHLARVNLLGDRAGDCLVRHISIKGARHRGNGIADSRPSGSGNLDVQLGQQQSSNFSRRRIQSHANHSLPKFPANRGKNRECYTFNRRTPEISPFEGLLWPRKRPSCDGSELGRCRERKFLVTGTLAI